ncbi:uncharacterized protein K452DRAFT_321734 [Aplosporella prunicola CBS 121167]|uniref:Mid2 domain-containing protein n=1 Tax=Aplosporella prunicola CBS 121167 TaxID=1176127 RepID=A0A6A6B0D8_9PEZI|nr:uncharacterized protein K452DRAFT_321734 [Aplosporella prunicola CBS 121167]KAF2137490.1 hypothetical protein K452DRAFT_321734 [Aplosporella prunicola CBS 121167]
MAVVLLVLTLCLHLPFVQGHAITPAARLPTYRVDYNDTLNEILFGHQPRLGKRDVTDCDGAGVFTCPIGTCYAGSDGFIGCCSLSSCAARTTCIDYNPRSKADCDPDTGGCVVCSKPELPFCATIFNQLSDQFIMFCATTSTMEYTQYAVVNSDLPSLSTALPPETTDSSTTAFGTKTVASVAPSTRIFTTVITEAVPDDSETSTVVTITETSVDVASASASAAPSDVFFGSGEDSDNNGLKLSTGAIIGIAIGGLVALASIAALTWFCVKHQGNRNQHDNASNSSPPLWQGPTSGPYGEVTQQVNVAELEDTSPAPTQNEWNITPELDSASVSPAIPSAPFTSEHKYHPASLTPGASVSAPSTL